jgi:hypothetical protein
MDSTKPTHSYRMCDAVSVAMWHLPQIVLPIEEPVLEGALFDGFRHFFPVDVLWYILVPQESRN